MAKLHARGRWERLRLESEIHNDLGTGWRQRAYMSDGSILSRYRYTRDSKASTWTVCGRVKADLSPRAIAETRAPTWWPVRDDRQRTPRAAGTLSPEPIVTEQQAKRRIQSRISRAKSDARKLIAAQEQARTIPADAVRTFVDRHTGSVHVGESLRFWVRSIMGRLQGGTATFRLMPRPVRKATIRHIAARRQAHRATYEAVMRHTPFMTERAIGARLLG